MSLLREIQQAAIQSDSDVPALLRKCKILAGRLGNDKFKAWVDWELNGYPPNEGLPDYRVIDVQSVGHFSGAMGSGLKNAPIPPSCINEKLRDIVTKFNDAAPISVAVDLLKKPNGSASFKSHWPADLIALCAGDIYENLNCMSAWRVIPRGAVVAMVDAVRNRILSFVLEIEAIAPDAGEALPGEHPIDEERISKVFMTNIYGNVGNFASGSLNVVQTISINITAGDVASLKQYLAAQGVQQNDLEELEVAIASDGGFKPSKGLGERVRGWMGKMIAGAGRGLWKVTTTVAADVITKSISAFYGHNI